MHMLRSRPQAGDTIVEVLIAIAVVSMVLVGAFVVSNNSTKTVQDNQEHTQAQQQLQAQVEALRSYLLTVSDASAIGSGNYCMNSNSPVAFNPATCPTVTIGGTTGQPYFSRSGDLYTFTITWDSIKGGTGKESFVYLAYPGKATP